MHNNCKKEILSQKVIMSHTHTLTFGKYLCVLVLLKSRQTNNVSAFSMYTECAVHNNNSNNKVLVMCLMFSRSRQRQPRLQSTQC